MVQPTQLLKNLGVVGRLIQHSLVRRLGTIKLRDNISMLREKKKKPSSSSHLSAVHEHVQSGTKCPPGSEVPGGN